MARTPVKYVTKKKRLKPSRVREDNGTVTSYIRRPPVNCIICGDCNVELKKLPSDCIDLIFTSPPYADSRKNTYGGIHPDRYAEWLLPITTELLRVLKPTGSFVLNIKEKAVNGERHTYVIDSILGMRRQGWLWTEEYIWRLN